MQKKFCRGCSPEKENVKCFETLLPISPNLQLPTLQTLGAEICNYFNEKSYAEWKKQSPSDDVKTIEVHHLGEWIKCTLDNSSWLFKDKTETISVRFSSESNLKRVTEGIYDIHFKSSETQSTQQQQKDDDPKVNIKPNNEGPGSNPNLNLNKAEKYKIIDGTSTIEYDPDTRIHTVTHKNSTLYVIHTEERKRSGMFNREVTNVHRLYGWTNDGWTNMYTYKNTAHGFGGDSKSSWIPATNISLCHEHGALEPTSVDENMREAFLKWQNIDPKATRSQ